MSIVAYVGRMGSGKSYGVVENVILPALKSGRTIVTNIPLKIGYLSDDYPDGKIIQFKQNDPLEDPDFFNLDRWAGAIIIIDEAWRYWSSGTKSNQIPENQKSFFTEHRHYVGQDGLTCEIVLVTQSLDQIANFVRELIEDTYRATKLSALGMSKSYRVDVFSGAQKGLTGGKPNRTLQGTYKPEVFKYYQSHTKNKTDFAAGMEEKADDRNNIFKSPLFKFVIPAALLCSIFAITSVLSYFDTTTGQQPETTQQPQTPQDDERAKQREKQKQETEKKRQELQMLAALKERDISEEFLPLSETYRIVGKINGVIMLHSEKGDRTVNAKYCNRFKYTQEEYCVYNQELVTWYSSTPPQQATTERQYLNTELQEIF